LTDVHDLASPLPDVVLYPTDSGRAIYQVHGKSFIFFRSPRPDAFDPLTGERYDDVIVFWVDSEDDKLAMTQDDASPFFTTPHFNHHLSVLLRASRVSELGYCELREVVQDAWLCRAPKRLAKAWLAGQGLRRSSERHAL